MRCDSNARDALQYLYTLLTLATTCVTVVYAYLNNQSEKMRTLIAGLGGNSTNAEDTVEAIADLTCRTRALSLRSLP